MILSIKISGAPISTRDKQIDELIMYLIEVFKGYEIEIDLGSSLYPSLDYFHDVITRNLTHSWLFRTELDEHGFQSLSDAKNELNLKTLGLEFCDTSKSIPKTITFSNPSTEALLVSSRGKTELDLHCKNLLSLKELRLRDCTITFDCLNSLPKSLHKLSIDKVSLTGPSNCAIKFPSHLQSLSIVAVKDRSYPLIFFKMLIPMDWLI
ncbi:unnamed protein product [Ambrosiozyma monospora]|uniref:Unnamed protein product n=1 Tax=Ambrosiozyma monospora TaxID=43982 RepID=A0ACB5SVP8_AMBMO|nr:unnamed protein product [Ambrosiozyma monospora]